MHTLIVACGAVCAETAKKSLKKGAYDSAMEILCPKGSGVSYFYNWLEWLVALLLALKVRMG